MSEILAALGAIADLLKRITGREPPYKADIHPEVLEHGFGPTSGSRRPPFRGLPTNPRGFDDKGLPDWVTLWAIIRIANRGREQGRWNWELDRSKTRLPPLFDCTQMSTEFFPARVIAGRGETSAQFFLDVLLNEKDPEAFAWALKTLVQTKHHYRVVINYRTERVDGKSKTRRLRITGDFKGFHQEVIEHWEGFGFKPLADIARLKS